MPEVKIEKSITRKLIVWVILFSSIITFVTTGYQLYRDYKQNLEVVHSNFAQLETSHIPSIREAVWNLDIKQVKILLDGIVALQNFRYTEIRDKDQILASSGKRKNGNYIQKQFELDFERQGAQLTIGSLIVEADLQAIYQRLLNKVGLILLSNGIKTFCVALFISFIFGYFVSRHLTTIATYAKNLSVENRGASLKLERPVSSPENYDELDNLVYSINEMQSNIVESRQALQDSHDKLEYLVDKRTRELSQSEEQLKAAQSVASIGSWQWNIATGEETWSDEQYRIFGHRPDGQPVCYEDFLNAVHPEDKQSVLDSTEKAMDGSQDYDIEFRIIRPNGEIRFIHAQAILNRDSEGNPESMLGTDHDITRKKQTQQQYRNMLENLADGAITIDEKGIISYVNPTTEKIFGYTAEEMVGSNVNMLMDEPEKSDHDKHLSRYQETGKSSIIGKGRQIFARRKNGSIFPADLNVSETIVDGQKTYFGTIRDMTERVKNEEELLRAKLDAESSNRVKSEFLANMSHELRTPLNAIIGFSETLNEQIFGPLGNEKQKEYITSIHSSGLHLLNLISDILDVSAIEADKMVLEETDVDLHETIRVSILLLKERAEKAKIKLRNTIKRNQHVIRADERRMKQIMLNLLSNAVKFTNDGGTVTIDVKANDDGSKTLSVIDSGIGMSADEIAIAMEPFRQIRRSGRSDVYVNEGTGLGLPLTLKLVEAQGGELLIESQPKTGTTVSVHFPANRVLN
ncbi:MAG: PAS domain S-box protein [Nitrospinae bacterium]|nr:PAS domain S-box protein [Nitrospinota bacterium]